MKFLDRFQTLTGQPHQLGYQEIEPHPLLKRYVRCFWTDHQSQTQSRVIPDLCTDILVYIDEASSSVHSKFCGINDTYFDTTTNLTSSVLGIRFFGWSGWLFSTEDFNSTKNTVVDLEDYFSMLTRLLQDERFIRMNLAQRIEAIELILLEKLEAEEKWLHPDFLNCMNLILQTDQPVDQNDLIRHCAIGARQLERLFRRYTGLTPKKMINLTRFQKVWRRMYCTRTCDSMELVHHFGYVDQSHFIREFKTFSGMTPNKMLQRL